MKKNYVYDVLRVLSCIGVIGIHTFKNSSIIGLICQAIVRIGLPMFLFISGSLNLKYKEEKTLDFYKKRFHKVIIPYIVYALIYVIYESISIGVFHRSRFIQIIENPSAINVHFWFVYSILGIYLATPFLRVMFKNMTNSIKKELTILLLVLAFILYTLPLTGHGIYITDFPFASWTIIFYLLGYLIGNEKIFNDKEIIFYILGIISFVISCIYGKNDESFYCSQLTMYFEVIAVYLLFNRLFKNKKNNKVILFISKYTYDIYLIHALFINIIVKYSLDNSIDIYTFKWQFIVLAIVFILSIISSFIIHNIIDIVYKFIGKILKKNKK